MDRNSAIADIQALFASYRAALPTDLALLQALSNGKLYELFVLADLVEDLTKRWFTLSFVGSSIKFKGGPGMIKLSDPHFEVRDVSNILRCRIFVDIEFDTLGTNLTGATDDSKRHEIDILVTTAKSGYPSHHEIALGIECKCFANFTKGLVKEALGVRREMCLRNGVHKSMLTTFGGRPVKRVPALPPSEFILAYIDGVGSNYTGSPGAFGIEFKHLEP